MLNEPEPDPVVPAPVPATVTAKEPVAPAKPLVPLVIAIVPGPLAVGVPAKTCKSSDGEAESVPVSVAVEVPAVTFRFTGTVPVKVTGFVKLKAEPKVPSPANAPAKERLPLAVIVPAELAPLPVIVIV